jgi:hypothetical protein
MSTRAHCLGPPSPLSPRLRRRHTYPSSRPCRHRRRRAEPRAGAWGRRSARIRHHRGGGASGVGKKGHRRDLHYRSLLGLGRVEAAASPRPRHHPQDPPLLCRCRKRRSPPLPCRGRKKRPPLDQVLLALRRSAASPAGGGGRLQRWRWRRPTGGGGGSAIARGEWGRASAVLTEE